MFPFSISLISAVYLVALGLFCSFFRFLSYELNSTFFYNVSTWCYKLPSVLYYIPQILMFYFHSALIFFKSFTNRLQVCCLISMLGDFPIVILISNLIPSWSENTYYMVAVLLSRGLFSGPNYSLCWCMFLGFLKRMCILLFLGVVCMSVKSCLFNGVQFFYVLDFLSCTSINWWEWGIDVPNYN